MSRSVRECHRRRAARARGRARPPTSRLAAVAPRRAPDAASRSSCWRCSSLLVARRAAGWRSAAYQAGTGAARRRKDVVLDLRGRRRRRRHRSRSRRGSRRSRPTSPRRAARPATPSGALAEHLPWVGRQPGGGPHRVRRRSTTWCATRCRRSSAIDDVLHAQEAPGTDGRIDLAPLVDAAPDIVAAAASAHAAQAAVGGDRHRRAGPAAGGAGRPGAGRAWTRSRGALDAGAQVATLLPPMLGADGPRTYLLVSLNSAELRSAGGIVGAFAVLHADDGTVDLTDQRTTIDLPGIDAARSCRSRDEELRFDTDRLGRWVQDAVMTPDFPRSAELLTARWERDMGQHVDGVVAADPVARLATCWAPPVPVTEPERPADRRDERPAGPAARRLPRHRRRRRGRRRVLHGRRRRRSSARSARGRATRGRWSTRWPGRAPRDGSGCGRRTRRSRRRWRRRASVPPSSRATFPDATGVFLNDGTGGQARLLPDARR